MKLKWSILLLAGALFIPAFADNAAPKKIELVRTVRTNPLLYFSGVPGDGELTRELRSFLGSCGWFDLTNDARAEYNLAAAKSGDSVTLTLTVGGASAGAWRVPLGPGNRKAAKNAVDAIIQQTFKELKVKKFCSTRIIFCADTASGVKNIYGCDIDGGAVEQLTNYNTLCVEPCFFPDGSTIGYSRYTRTGIDVVETRFNPTRSRVLTSFRGINAGAAISPDGRNLAVILSPDHKVDLYTLPIGGRQLTRLTDSISVEASPCWSPDGREIAYVSDESGQPRINIIPAGGGKPRAIRSIGRNAVTPDWSSDNKIVYAALMGDGAYTLAVYDVATGKNERITEEPGNWESPGWAADNRQVVCKRSSGNSAALYVVDTWTGKTRLLLRTSYNLSMPAWSRAESR